MPRSYFQPTTAEEALMLRAQHPQALVVAGGTDVLVELHQGHYTDRDLLDLSHVNSWKSIENREGEIHIGALATFSHIAGSKLLQGSIPALSAAALTVGSPQIRARATMAGNVVNANPCADSVPVLLTLEASVVLLSQNGQRTMGLDEFIFGKGKTALKETELISGFMISTPSKGTRMSHGKIGRRNALNIARINGCCALIMKGDAIGEVRVVLGSVTSTPCLFLPVDNYLRGKQPTDSVLTKAGELAAELVLAQTGRRSSHSYKLPVIRDFVGKLVRDAVEGRT